MQPHFFRKKEMLVNMNKNREIQEKQVYLHFKGGCYFVEMLAFDSATEEEVVVYRNLDSKNVWVRPLNEFMDVKETDKGYAYKFTLCEL